MVAKHIPRDYSAHRKNTIRPTGEYCGLEIFSFNPYYTRYYIRENNSLPQGDNCKLAHWRSWACYSADNTSSDMNIYVDYYVQELGDYRIDLLYEQNSALFNGQDLTGELTITSNESIIYNDDNLLFDGEDNYIKRIPVFLELNQGNHTISVDVPPNCYFYGIVVRKIVKYTANNYFGADAGKDSGNMMFKTASLSLTDMSKASELSVTVAYDNDYECDISPSGFYIDYRDEVNFYIKNDDGQIVRAFGGYVSSVLPNADMTELTIACADRLSDGTNKYVLDKITLQGGKDERSDKNKDFDTYTHILKYLCDAHEVTLQSNITPNYLVEGEKFNEGFTITYGKEKTVASIPVSNGDVTVSNNHVTLRNKSSGANKQVWTLYDARKYGQVAPNITNAPYVHITYGLGSPKTSVQTKTTEKVDTSDVTAGTQKFGKCGQSEDKKYVMAIGKVSGSKKGNFKANTYYKTVFENKCPYCGKPLVWDSGRSDTDCVHCGGYKHSKREWGNISETELTCTGCCSDFDAVTGYEKISNPKKKVKKVSSSVKSSKAEQDKLHKGQMRAVPKTGVTITPDDIFKAITNEAFKYKYKRGGASSYNAMKKSGSGDCHAFSDLIFTMLKKYGVSCKIVQYKTGSSNQHRSVLYKNEKKEWVDFPYKAYGWDKKYKNNLNATSGSRTGSKIQSFKGTNIGNIQAKSTTTNKSQTTTITTTKNYDKDKPFQGYLKITYSNSQELNAPKKTMYMKFTLGYTVGDALNDKGFNLYWVNNDTRKATFLGTDGKPLNIINWLRQVHNSTEDVYLQSIQMITPKKTPTSENDDGNWFKYDKSTHDESSCKMDLYQISFDNDNSFADTLDSCGKSVNEMLKTIVDDTGYLVYMEYGLHRIDDRIHFRVNNSRESSYTASEGDNNNILNWNSISYSPISSLYNMSIQVFKKDNLIDEYHYVDSRVPTSILNYGEQATLQTSNEPISQSEAYFNARMNPKFNADETYSYTITVPNYPNLKLGEFVKIIANAKKLNSVKEVKSLKITFKHNGMPRITTEIGLDELAPDLQLRDNLRELRSNAKKESTDFTSSATPINDESLYQWDR